MQRERQSAEAELENWAAGIAQTSNDVFLPLFFDEHRFLVLKGGAGSGKSIFAGRKVIERCISEPGHRILICRKVGRTLRESCFAQILAQLSRHYPGLPVKISRTERVISFPGGSQLLFAGLDDVEKLKSIYSITSIWIEEATELSQSDFNQLNIRLRGKTPFYKQIIITFNPVSALHWIKSRFFDISSPAEREKIRIHESTYRDNRFLDDESKAELEAFRETDEYYYSVYCLGQWGITGRSVFPAAKIHALIAAGLPEFSEGEFLYAYDGLSVSGIEWAPAERLPVRIFEHPREGVPYVIGADTAGGGSDRFCAQVIDNRSGMQAAVLHGNFSEDYFVRQLFCLGSYYNTALIAVECNFSSYAVLELERLGYSNQYVRHQIDVYTHSPTQHYGFRTDSKSRPVAISTLVRALENDISLVRDRATLEELLTFVRDESFRPAAEPGAHDDAVMALAIAHYVRPQQSYTARGAETPGLKWTADMHEDYARASAADKRYLLARWGLPGRR